MYFIFLLRIRHSWVLVWFGKFFGVCLVFWWGFFGDFAIWSFLVYILFKVSMSSHKWTRVCSSALTINWISLSLILFSVWSILILFLSCWLFFYSTASRILNPPMQNHLYTPSFLFAIFFFFFSPVRQGRQCDVLDISTVHLRYTETFDFTLCHF